MSAQEMLVYLCAAVAYFVPFYIARYRKVNGQKIVFWFNLFFGWTLIAWFLLVIVALSLRTHRHQKHAISL